MAKRRTEYRVLAFSTAFLLALPSLAGAGFMDTLKEGFVPKRDTQTDSTAARGIDEEEAGAGKYSRDPEAMEKIMRLSSVSSGEMDEFIAEGGLHPKKKP